MVVIFHSVLIKHGVILKLYLIVNTILHKILWMFRFILGIRSLSATVLSPLSLNLIVQSMDVI